jgi:hypothetical protein
MSCGEWCVFYKDKGKTSACFRCDDNIPENKPHVEFGKVDIWELARGLQKKREEQEKIQKQKLSQEATKGSSDKNDINIIKQTDDYILSVCPMCSNGSLFYYKQSNKIECLNKRCRSNNVGYNAPAQDPPKSSQIKEIRPPNQTSLELDNPILLSVKMFLADVIYIVNRKYEEGHVCSDFSQEVCEAATERSIRCGYVVIYFKQSNIAHAIVAFQTDYGLKFFEPQNANEVEVIIGHRYFTQVKGTSEENIISKVEITWNDGAITEIGYFGDNRDVR